MLPVYGLARATSSFNSTPKPGAVDGMTCPSSKRMGDFRISVWNPPQVSILSRMRKLRVFECAACGHKLRFGAENCGKCYTPTPLRNRIWTYAIAALIALFLILQILVLLDG